MSTYTALFCKQCNEMTDFMAQRLGYSWMAEADKNIPAFIARHSEHFGEITIIDEHDSRWDSAKHFPDDDD